MAQKCILIYPTNCSEMYKLKTLKLLATHITDPLAHNRNVCFTRGIWPSQAQIHDT